MNEQDVIDPQGASEDGPEEEKITVASLLGIEDEQEQVEWLQQAFAMKPSTLTISVSPVTGNMGVIANQNLSYKQLHAMLGLAGEALHEQEKEGLLQNQARALAMKQQEADKEAKESDEVEV